MASLGNVGATVAACKAKCLSSEFGLSSTFKCMGISVRKSDMACFLESAAGPTAPPGGVHRHLQKVAYTTLAVATCQSGVCLTIGHVAAMKLFITDPLSLKPVSMKR